MELAIVMTLVQPMGTCLPPSLIPIMITREDFHTTEEFHQHADQLFLGSSGGLLEMVQEVLDLGFEQCPQSSHLHFVKLFQIPAFEMPNELCLVFWVYCVGRCKIPLRVFA